MSRSSKNNNREHRISFCLSTEERELLELKRKEKGYHGLSGYIRDRLLYDRESSLRRIKEKIVIKISEMAVKIREVAGENAVENAALKKMKRIIITELIDLVKMME